MQFCTPQRRLCGNLSIGVKKWSRFPQRNLMLAKFYFLVNLRKEEEAAWLSCKLILLSFTLDSFLFSQGLCFFGWLSLTRLSVTATCSTWAADVARLSDRTVLEYPFYRFNRCGSISGREFDEHTCGRDHLLLTTSTFLQLAVSGINGLYWIQCVCGRNGYTTLQIGLWQSLEKKHTSYI